MIPGFAKWASRLAFAVVAAGAALWTGMGAEAQSLFVQRTDYAILTLHEGRKGEGHDRIAALRMELKPGWKTYWRIPGDSGVPPTFDWTGSENLANAATSWEVPKVFETYGDRTIGYEGRMIVPLTLTPVDPEKPIRVRLNFTYGVCKDICIPAGETFAIDIEPGAPADGAYFIDKAMSRRLGPAEPGAVEIVACDVTGTGDARVFEATLKFASSFSAPPTILVEGPEGVTFGKVHAAQAGGVVTAKGPVRTRASSWISRDDIRMTILGDGRGMVLKGC